MLSAVCFNLDQSKILSSGNKLTTLTERAFLQDHGEMETSESDTGANT